MKPYPPFHENSIDDLFPAPDPMKKLSRISGMRLGAIKKAAQRLHNAYDDYLKFPDGKKPVFSVAFLRHYRYDGAGGFVYGPSKGKYASLDFTLSVLFSRMPPQIQKDYEHYVHFAISNLVQDVPLQIRMLYDYRRAKPLLVKNADLDALMGAFSSYKLAVSKGFVGEFDATFIANCRVDSGGNCSAAFNEGDYFPWAKSCLSRLNRAFSRRELNNVLLQMINRMQPTPRHSELLSAFSGTYAIGENLIAAFGEYLKARESGLNVSFSSTFLCHVKKISENEYVRVNNKGDYWYLYEAMKKTFGKGGKHGEIMERAINELFKADPDIAGRMRRHLANKISSETHPALIPDGEIGGRLVKSFEFFKTALQLGYGGSFDGYFLAHIGEKNGQLASGEGKGKYNQLYLLLRKRFSGCQVQTGGVVRAAIMRFVKDDSMRQEMLPFTTGNKTQIMPESNRTKAGMPEKLATISNPMKQSPGPTFRKSTH